MLRILNEKPRENTPLTGLCFQQEQEAALNAEAFTKPI